MSDDERLERGKVLARVIIEILGAPKEHIEDTIKKYIEKLKKREDLEFVSERFEPAIPQDKLFTTFAELEIWFKNVPELIGFCFDALPSSVEILQPGNFKLDASDLTGLINDLQARLHKIDMELKNTKAENVILNNHSFSLIHNMIFISVRHIPKTLEQLQKEVGIKEELLKQVLDKMLEAKKIAQEGNLYKPA